MFRGRTNTSNLNTTILFNSISWVLYMLVTEFLRAKIVSFKDISLNCKGAKNFSRKSKQPISEYTTYNI